MSTRTFIDSGDEQIYFECWGEADETVVLTHGLGGNHAVWYQQVAHLSQRYRVITWDQRGFGRSSRDTARIGPVPAVGDMAAIADRLGIERMHLVGQSMGGWVALGFAISHPRRVASLVLADTTAGIFTPQIRSTLTRYGEMIATAPSPDEMPLGFHPAVGTQLLSEDLAHAFLYGQLGSLTEPPTPAEIMPLLMGTDHTAGAAGIDVPTLFVVGEHDPIFPPSLIETAAGMIDGARVSVVDNTGHSPYFERPAAWNDIVGRFLRESR